MDNRLCHKKYCLNKAIICIEQEMKMSNLLITEEKF